MGKYKTQVTDKLNLKISINKLKKTKLQPFKISKQMTTTALKEPKYIFYTV